MKQELLVIDDRRLREASFREAEKFLAKMDRLERFIQVFYERDQKLFNDWSNLTFRENRRHIEALRQKWSELAELHNWIVAVAEQLDIEIYEAYRIVIDEKWAFEHGSETDRQAINEERERRDEYIRTQVEDDHQHETHDTPPADTRSSKEEKEFSKLCDLSDERLGELCSDPDQAFELLSRAIHLCRSREDYALFVRIWDQVPPRYQKQFAKSFTGQDGTPLSEVIEQMRQDLEDKEDPTPLTTPEPTPLSKAEEEIKLYYRKLVRLLHPDLWGGKISQWQQKLWLRLQSAYQDKDRSTLERLLKLTLLRSKKLDELTLSEIQASRDWLADELHALESDARKLKRLPAWGFSRKKDLQALTRRIRKEIENEESRLKAQVDEIEHDHHIFDLLCRAEPPRTRHRSKPRSRNASRTSRCYSE